MSVIEVAVPDIGDFGDVPVIEILVSPRGHGRRRGSAGHARVRQGDDGRARRPFAGTVKELQVKVGDKVSQGTVLLTLDATDSPESTTPSESAATAGAPAPSPPSEEAPVPTPAVSDKPQAGSACL